MTDVQQAIDYIRSAWPRGFTKPELYEALQIKSGLREMRRHKAIEDTGVRRRHGKRRYVVWRYKPYQLPLPLEGNNDHP